MSASPELSAVRDLDTRIETILTQFDTHYIWDYASTKEGLHDLYEKAKRDQWNSTEQLAWDTPVDPEDAFLPEELNPLKDFAPYQKLDPAERRKINHAQIALQLSQFLHGEQGALIVASQLVAGVPWIDAKFYAGTQTMDEARHVEVFGRYLHEKLEWEWPINPHLKSLLDATIGDSRWDFKYLGMQIIIEGLAMAAFGSLHQVIREPLLKDLIHNVMRDESRHVAFGVLSLKDYYKELSSAEMADREEFILYACELMRDRLVGTQISEVMGWNEAEVQAEVMGSPVGQAFRGMLFQRVVPNLKRLDLLTPRVRDGFEKLDILKFEDSDPEEQDRQLGFA